MTKSAPPARRRSVAAVPPPPSSAQAGAPARFAVPAAASSPPPAHPPRRPAGALPKDEKVALFAACDIVPLGDGSYRAIPRRPQVKVGVREAARLAGCPRANIYRLLDAGFLQGERPSPRKILILVESLQAHLQAARDPEFWTPERRRRYLGQI